MKIEAGRYYRTRDGQKVGPMTPTYRGRFRYTHRWTDSSGKSWRDDGVWSAVDGIEDQDDIVSEWIDTPDLTAITTPLGLLDDTTREALKAHGGPYEMFCDGGWKEYEPAWCQSNTYRVKPSPPKPREWWIVNNCEAWGDREEAKANCPPGAEIVHVREVTQE